MWKEAQVGAILGLKKGKSSSWKDICSRQRNQVFDGSKITVILVSGQIFLKREKLPFNNKAKKKALLNKLTKVIMYT